MSTDRTRRRRSQRGITLIETLVALGLFAVSAATIGKYLVTHIRLAASNYLYTQAYVIAEQELETMRALRFNDMVPASKLINLEGRKYNVNTTVQDNTPASGMKQITVNVAWSDPMGPKNVAVRTIYTEVQR